MSIEFNITLDDNWCAYEAKLIDITVTNAAGVAVDLTGKTLQYRVMRDASPTSTVYLTKLTGLSPGITITGASSNVARVQVTADDYGVGELSAGHFWHELWDKTADERLTHGTAAIGQGGAPDA